MKVQLRWLLANHRLSTHSHMTCLLRYDSHKRHPNSSVGCGEGRQKNKKTGSTDIRCYMDRIILSLVLRCIWFRILRCE